MKSILRLLLASLIVIAVSSPTFAAATVTVINLDGPGEGFNDPTAAPPVGGNPGTTKGQQRLIAFNHAAQIWAQTLDSNIEIRVQAAFNPLAANVLGSAGATRGFINYSPIPPFPGPEFANMIYSSALADKRAGREVDTNPTPRADINAQFSSNFDFYLGLDGNHGPQNDLIAVLLHELGHGLGFQTFANSATGAFNSGFTDTYAHRLKDDVSGLFWEQMTTNAQRAASAINWGHLVFDAPEVNAGVPRVLSFGSPTVEVTAPSTIARIYQFGTASFGAQISFPGVDAAIVPAVDAVDAGGTSTDGCSTILNDVSGKIALIERGLCEFGVKVLNAEQAGARGVIIYNNAANAAAAPASMGPGAVGNQVTIVAVSLTRADGVLIAGASGTTGRIRADLSIRAGATAAGLARMYAPTPLVSGSSVSHYDTLASRNLLMEPAISGDLTHSVQEPEDLTLNLMRDIGWYPDADVEGIADSLDNCPFVPNADQANADNDSRGNVCDNCQTVPNSNQSDVDNDTRGDVCDNCLNVANTDQANADNDSRGDVCDNCATVANSDQANNDGDSQGDACDADDDNDGVPDATDVVDFSDLRPTVRIQNCESGSPNVLFPDGSTLMDRIAALIASNPKNQGQFQAALNQSLIEAMNRGMLTGAQKAAIDVCAAHSTIGG